MNVYDLTNFPKIPERIAKRWPFIVDSDLSDFAIANNGVGGTARSVVEDFKGGRYALTGDNTTDNHGAQMQSDAEIVLLAAGEPVVYRFVYELDGDNTQSDAWHGWCDTTAGIIPNVPANMVALRKDDGDTVWDLVIRKASGTAQVVTGVFASTLNQATVVLEIIPLATFATDGRAKINIFLNGQQVFGESGGGDATTNIFSNLPIVEMNWFAAVQNGDGVTKEILYCDDLTIDIPEYNA